MQYFNLAKESYFKYGLSVIQLIQIGKFYELWHEPDTPSGQQAYSQAEFISWAIHAKWAFGGNAPHRTNCLVTWYENNIARQKILASNGVSNLLPYYSPKYFVG